MIVVEACSTSGESRTSRGCARWRGCKPQLEHLIAVLARKCSELEKLKGSGGELQVALKLLEEAQQEAAKLDEG